MIPLYEVRADWETGEWLGEPDLIGEVDASEWTRLGESYSLAPEVHHDCFERGDQTCAVRVTFVK